MKINVYSFRKNPVRAIPININIGNIERMNTIFVETEKQEGEKYYLPLECIYLLFQVSICCLQFIFNGSRGYCGVRISIEEYWWICYHIGTCGFLEYELPADVEFNVFAFTMDDSSYVVHDDIANPVEDVFCCI